MNFSIDFGSCVEWMCDGKGGWEMGKKLTNFSTQREFGIRILWRVNDVLFGVCRPSPILRLTLIGSACHIVALMFCFISVL